MPKVPNPLKKIKRNFAEQFFPARPQRLLAKASQIAKTQLEEAQKFGAPSPINTTYVSWLKKQSMLHNANLLASKYSGSGHMWRNPFAKPRPRHAVKLASVWFTAYPISHITRGNQSILAALAEDELWSAFKEIGIKGLHTGPLKQAGGLHGWQMTPSVDGQFDRISNRIDSVFGTEAEFKGIAEMAKRYDGIVIDDIVPGHTGKGADFRLAEMNFGDYPGIYHMVEIYPKDWHLLPEVPKGQDATNIDLKTEEQLKKHGYIIGKLQRIIFFEPGVKETNWSATRTIWGTDGIKRRWVYLHYFKAGQPSINWLDPSFAGMKLVIGDALHSLGELGSQGLRLDANGFLGIEVGSEDQPAWSEGHPLSEAANQIIASMVRKLGGFTFQELNLSIENTKTMSETGADLSYDFINRPAYHHALATSDTEFLRLSLRLALDTGVDPASLVHGLQNHDDLTYEMVHFWTLHKDDLFDYHGKEITGSSLRNIIRKDLRDNLAGITAPYNLLFTENGIACTTVSALAAVLGVNDIHHLENNEIETIKRMHLLLVMFNALQPGVFALSGWDLSGALTLDANQVKSLIADGDTRWINRGAYDLLGSNPKASYTSSGMPKAVSLYGTLPQQLADENSFVRQLKKILEMREEYSIATSHQIDIPDVPDKSLLVMTHRLPHTDNVQMTILNFSSKKVLGTVYSDQLPVDVSVGDMFSGKKVATVSKKHDFEISLEPYEGTSLLINSS